MVRRIALFSALILGAFAAGVIVRARAPAHDRVVPPSAAKGALPDRGPRGELRVPHAAGPIVLDGDMDDPGWVKETARTGAFREANDLPANPYSDARLVWGDGHLYVALYAADEDIHAAASAPDSPLSLEDSFHLRFAGAGWERSIDVSPLGLLSDGETLPGGAYDARWQSGAHVSHEVDGTLNDPRDDDEEWVIEMAIPFESLGLQGKRGERLDFSVRRCDQPKTGPRVCASWGEGTPGGSILLD